MHARFLLGPAGSGKTHRCLEEIRTALKGSPVGPPLLLVAPKQMTYQHERQLLADDALPGYTRLQVLSFERLAFWLLDQLGEPPPRLLDAEGRVMVLRALLAKKRQQLKLFRASARLTGFAQELSNVLAELQSHQLTPAALRELAARLGDTGGIGAKLEDFATLLEDYLAWLAAHELQDAAGLLDVVATALNETNARLGVAGLWVDGFAEFAPQELALLTALAPHGAQATLTFCLDREPTEKVSWLSMWSLVRNAYEECRGRFAKLPDCAVTVEVLTREPRRGRFAASPVLEHLEQCWPEPRAFTQGTSAGDALRVVQCANPEAEAVFAAREVLRFVRGGGRFRDAIVLVRALADHHETLQRVFSRYEIPFFLDRRESVSHHPLAELTRSALRTVAFEWRHEDWFAALKAGFAPAADEEIDHLENEALARGWTGPAWLRPLASVEQPREVERCERLRSKLVPPFANLALTLATHRGRPNGVQLSQALRTLWRALRIEEQLETWARTPTDTARPSWPTAQAGAVHATVWEQMNAWLENLEHAFREEALGLGEWLPILEAGLSSLTVGLIPPALDQVLIGAVDRSRNPDVKLALVLGLNEGVFPARPQASPLLTDAERDLLAQQGLELSAATRRQLGRERHLGYVACTRARRQLILTCARGDASGQTLNPSPFLAHVRRLFPSLKMEVAAGARDATEAVHVHELISQLLTTAEPQAPASPAPAFAGIQPALVQLREYETAVGEHALKADLVERLYGPILRSSVSRLEQFAACPFRFFVQAGLRAEERRRFEADPREQGTFQHEVLALFHRQLAAEGKRWRDLTPADARERVAQLATALAASFREGLFAVSGQTRFTARLLTEALQDFIEVLVDWMRGQYAFDPVAVELEFGHGESAPPWELELGDGHRLALQGRIDRVDVCPERGDTAWCVVVDYKSGQKELDPVLLAHGVQLQLPVYLSALRHWPNPQSVFGVARWQPAGVFYVSLRGRYERGADRDDALGDAGEARRLAYRHTGRFDLRALPKLDSRAGAAAGDQFNYRRNKKDGTVARNCREALPSDQFAQFLLTTEENLKRLGRGIFAGEAQLDPYRWRQSVACDQCDFKSVCRIDPWTHRYRALRPATAREDKKESGAE